MAKPTQSEIAALVRAHSNRLHRFFCSSGVPRAEAQDLVQATFEVFLTKLDGPIEDVDRYLWGIARKKLLQTRTRLKTYEEFHQSQFAASTTTISRKVDRRLRVSVLLARLDEEERTIFLMRCEGLTIEQIAAAVDKGPATIKRRLADARRHIDAIASETRTPDDAIGVEDVEDTYRHDGA
ncbi:MAG: sigma-70 family RNA polymerase sigma factor [Myxococcales bacterium]|nr:sigma-70 family RNA polymerase sigma factor [Myxococcales bacterium]